MAGKTRKRDVGKTVHSKLREGWRTLSSRGIGKEYQGDGTAVRIHLVDQLDELTGNERTLIHITGKSIQGKKSSFMFFPEALGRILIMVRRSGVQSDAH